MGNICKTAFKGLAAAAILAAVPIGVQAANTWTFHYEDNCTAGCDDNYYNGSDWSRTYTGFDDANNPAGSVTVYGIYNDGTAAGPAPSSGAGNGAGDLWLGPIDAWDGLGVHTYGEGWDAPQHSTDSYGSIESILFDFGSSIALSEVSIGWKYNDADISVLAYVPDGGDPLTPTIAANASGAGGYTSLGSSYASLLSTGWEEIGQYSNLNVGATRDINGGDVSSRYWLISAATSVLGWSGDSYYDKFKILTVAGSVPSNGGEVPVPGTLMLFGLIGAGAASRRWLRKQA